MVSDFAPQDEVNEGKAKSSDGLALSTYTELFAKTLPYYMAIGMSVEEFYDGDCTLCIAYREAHKHRTSLRNQEMWLQGMYVYEAILDCVPVLHAMPKKDAKPIPYSKHPYPLTDEEKEMQEEQEAKEKAEKIREAMDSFMANIESKERGNKDG